jgi:hypothetical protein
LVASALVGSGLLAPAVEAQSPGGGAAPSAFDVDAGALPVLIAASAPSALPLDVAAGVGFAGAKLNSQPKGTAEAAPGYVPLAGALPLLGGPGALPGIAARIVPGLLVGFPTIVGLPPIPVDPTLVPVPNIPVLPAPPLPPIECFASVPGDPEPISCGGPTQDVLGFTMGAGSGTASAQGDPNDKSTLRVDAAVRGGGFGPAGSNSLLPISAGSIASSATSYVKEGRVIAGVSTAVQDISMFGTIKIPSMETSISAALDGTPENAAVQGERCTITGATVAGVPVTIDGDGIHVATQNQPLGGVLGTANQLVQNTLNSLGVTLKTVAAENGDPGSAQAVAFPGQATISADGTKLAASLACLEVGYKVPTSGSVLTLTFGRAAVAMQAFTALPSTAGFGSSTPSGAAGGAASGSGTAAASPTAKSAPSGIAAPAAPVAGAGAPAPSTTEFQEVGFGWRIPYPPFGVLALALPLVIWSRRIGPLHLPRPSVPGRLLRGSGRAAP